MSDLIEKIDRLFDAEVDTPAWAFGASALLIEARAEILRLRGDVRTHGRTIRSLSQDKAFYRCCALSGEVPLDGSEPSARPTPTDEEMKR